VTVIMPIHNEENMLRLTLRSVYALQPNEIIFCLDRCTDGSERLIRESAEARGMNIRLLFFNEEDITWRFRSAYMRRLAYFCSSNDTILNTSADLNLDPKIGWHLTKIPEYGLISFGYLDRWTLATFAGRLHQLIRKDGFGGLLALSREAWLNTENIQDLKKVAQGEDDHLHHAIASKYKTCNIVTNSLHLRPVRWSNQYLCGVDTRRAGEVSGATLLYRSLLRLNPEFIVGYRHACMVKQRGGDLDEFAYRVIQRSKGRVNHGTNL
jgi:glycosyltransferase involved in cell wall biosynthesis